MEALRCALIARHRDLARWLLRAEHTPGILEALDEQAAIRAALRPLRLTARRHRLGSQG